ncbi:extracellular solute-binding protein [Myxococcus sp. AB056]|uniref:extracellular solute-binding protein n=1 Tax=Myxococcus sp. AB056 TaxID=2562792 RepID=UPI00114683D6|nr:extracellular solute-binding protein [Myxococcus sp. AB056]
MSRWLGLALLATALSAQAAPATEKPLKLWHAYRGGEEMALVQATELFTSKTGVQVELLALPYDAYAAKLTNAIPHGVGPDVFIFNHERLRNFHAMHLVAPASGLAREDYFPNAVEALEVDGQVYGYPMSLKSLALYVNTKLVPQPPETTDALLAMLPALSDADAGRFGLAYESGDFYFHAGFLFGFGGELFDANGRASFDTQGMARSLAFVKDLQDQRFIPQEASGALVKSLFNDGRAAMIISGPWFAGEIAPQVEYRVVGLPTVSTTNIPIRPFLGVETAYVSARSERAEQAQALARFISLGEASRVRAMVGRQIPADVAAYTLNEVREDTLISSFREAARHATPMPNTLEMARVWEPMKLALRAVLQGGTAPQDAGALADRRYRALHRERPPDASPMPWLGLVGAMALGGSVYVLRRPAATLPFKRRYPDVAQAVAYITPAAAGVALLVFVPFAVGLSLSLFHHEAGEYSFVGLANFVDILASRGYSITEPLSFYFTLAVTLLWAVVNVVLHVSIGLFLALLLKDPLLKLRGVYRVLLIIPWAVPNYITALMWKGMFHRQFGAINGLLVALDLEPVSWFTRFSTAFAANVATNTWLGFPFMMVVALGALQSIPQELYEAAEVDGASKWTQFRRITLPLLRPAMLPAVILGSVWTFNMFNIIYLVSGGEPGGGTDILVSEAYRWAFQRNEQYGFAAAYSVLIFVVLLVWSAFTKRLMRSSSEVMG